MIISGEFEEPMQLVEIDGGRPMKDGGHLVSINRYSSCWNDMAQECNL